MNKTQIEQEIKSNSPDDKKADLLKFLGACKTSFQWKAFTVCHWRKTGLASYEAVRVWTLHENMKDLLSK